MITPIRIIRSPAFFNKAFNITAAVSIPHKYI